MAAEPTGTTQGSGLARISQAQGALLGAGVAAAGGLLADALAPRGAATTAQVLATMAIALVVGVAGGCLARTRWVLLLQLAAWIVAVEIGRRGVAVPSLDARLDTVYGIIALLITRGLDGILLVLPLATGAHRLAPSSPKRRSSAARAIAARRGPRRPTRPSARIPRTRRRRSSRTLRTTASLAAGT